MNGERSEPAVTCSCSREKFGENRQILANYEGGLYATVSNLRSISVSLFFFNTTDKRRKRFCLHAENRLHGHFVSHKNLKWRYSRESNERPLFARMISSWWKRQIFTSFVYLHVILFGRQTCTSEWINRTPLCKRKQNETISFSITNHVFTYAIQREKLTKSYLQQCY